MSLLAHRCVTLLILITVGAPTLAQDMWPFRPLTTEEERAMAETTPVDPITWEYAYGGDFKANLRLAWYRDLDGYIKYQKKWVKFAKKHMPDPDPVVPSNNFMCQKGLLFIAYIASKNYKHASKELAGNETLICNSFTHPSRPFPDSNLTGTQFGNWLNASRTGSLKDILDNAKADQQRGDFAARSALMALVQFTSYKAGVQRHLAQHRRNRERESGVPSWSQIIVGGLAQIANTAANANQQRTERQAALEDEQQRAMVAAQGLRQRQIEEVNRQTESDRIRWEQARIQAAQQHKGVVRESSSRTVVSKRTIGPSKSGQHTVPNVNKCVIFEDLHQGDRTVAWFRLRNVCGQTVTAYWCGSRGERCRFSEAATLLPGKSTDGWFILSKYTGISRMACPESNDGKKVYLNFDQATCYTSD